MTTWYRAYLKTRPPKPGVSSTRAWFVWAPDRYKAYGPFKSTRAAVAAARLMGYRDLLFREDLYQYFVGIFRTRRCVKGAHGSYLEIF